MKTKTSPIDQHYMDDNGNEIELDTTGIDSFYSEETPHYAKAGYHVVRLIHAEMEPEKTVTSRTGVYVKKAHIIMDLRDVKTGEVITTKLYPNFTPYFMDQIAKQSEGTLDRAPLSEVLKYMTRSDIEIWITYDRVYGVQVNYREPRE